MNTSELASEMSSTRESVSNEFRRLLIKRITVEGYSIKDAAMLTDIKYSNALKIYANYIKDGSIEKKKTGFPSNKKVTDDMCRLVENLIEQTPTIILRELKVKIFETCEVEVSIETIRKVIKSLGITRKCVVYTGVQINSERNKALRKNYARLYLNTFPNDNINIFIDESGFNLHLRRKHGRSLRGNIVPGLIPATRGTNVSLISAITCNEVVHSKCITGSVKGETFKDFIAELTDICRTKFPNTPFNLFVDNARAHHANLVRDYLVAANLVLNFLSPYSYMLNPIEYSFSKIKAVVRRELSAGYSGEFFDLIKCGVDELRASDLAGYFIHMRNNCVKAVEEEDFL